MPRPSIVLVTLGLTAALVACSGSGSKAAAPTTTAGASTTAGTAAATGDSAAPTIATTTIPVASGSAPAATSPPGAPATDGSAADGATTAPAAPAADPATSAPGPTSPPVTDINDGDPTTFCPAVDKAVPLYFVMSLGGINGDATAAASYEVATAPVLAGPLGQAASSAPSVLAGPFKRWSERNAKAVAAFQQTGATPAQIAAFAAAYQAQIDKLSDAGGTQTTPDPVAAARAAGIDTAKLAAAATAFAQANGTFDDFAKTLGQDVNLTPAAEQKLEQTYPCAADLGTLAGNE